MTQFFEYSEYDDDFIQKVIRDYGDQMPDWVKGELGKYAVTHKDRDSDLEDFLQSDQFVPSLSVSRVLVSENMGTSGSVTFEGIDFQSTNLFDWIAGDPSKVTALESGIVSINGFMSIAGSAAGTYRTAIIQVNGTTPVAAQTSTIPGAADMNISLPGTTYLAAGDYVKLAYNQDSGGTLQVTGRISLSYLGRQG